jgi:hypothetical protein
MKTPKITEEDLINLWLEKYHNTNIEKILEENPTWKENPNEHTREFYEKYKVTQEQHDEWVIEAKELLRVKLRRSKKYIDKTWWSVYLNCSPSILVKAIFKFNGGNGALLCSGCSKIIKTGQDFTDDEWAGLSGEKNIPPQYCNECKIL